MPDGTLATALRLLSFLGSTVIGIRLWSWRLWRRYPFFFIFLALLAAWALGTLCLDVRSKAFYRFWKYTTPVTWIVDVLMVVELSRLVLESYRGLYSLFRNAMLVCVVVSVGVSALNLAIETAKQANQQIALYLAVDRTLQLALALFILLILLFLSRYPISLSRNVRAYALIYSIYFLMNTIGVLLRSLHGKSIGDAVNMMLGLVETGALGCWLYLLNPAGERIPEPASRVTSEHEQRLLSQLDALNSTLVRARR
jgi:hypothetical protein